MEDKEINKLAETIARDIMECGDEMDSPCQRLQFKGGRWPETERDQGGICEDALVTLVAMTLRKEAKK